MVYESDSDSGSYNSAIEIDGPVERGVIFNADGEVVHAEAVRRLNFDDEEDVEAALRRAFDDDEPHLPVLIEPLPRDEHRRPRQVVYSEEDERFIEENIWTEENPEGYTGIQMFIIVHVIGVEHFLLIPPEERIRAIMNAPREYDEQDNIVGHYDGETVRFDAYGDEDYVGLAFTIECFLPCEHISLYGPHRRRHQNPDGTSIPLISELVEYAPHNVPIAHVRHMFSEMLRNHSPVAAPILSAQYLRLCVVLFPRDQQASCAAHLLGLFHEHCLRTQHSEAVYYEIAHILFGE